MRTRTTPTINPNLSYHDLQQRAKHLLAAAQLAYDWEEGKDCGVCSSLDVVRTLRDAIKEATQ